MPMPTEIPENIWRDMKLMQDRLTSFWRDAQGAANDQEHQTGRPADFGYYRWLEPIAQALDANTFIKT